MELTVTVAGSEATLLVDYPTFQGNLSSNPFENDLVIHAI
jgi:hypothetical protein